MFDGDHIYTVGVRYRPTALTLNRSGSPSDYFNVNAVSASAKPSNESSITATQVIISAQYVDVSGTITAGPIKNRNLTIGATVDDLSKPIYTWREVRETYRDEYGVRHFAGEMERVQTGYEQVSLAKALGSAKGGSGAATIDLTQQIGSYTAGGSGLNLGAQFFRTGVDEQGNAIGTIKVDDIVAAGGGSITIAGKILNTNPVGGGMLKVLNGYGNISVDNQTGYDLNVGTINAGLSADGRITLRDTALNGSVTVTEFTNSVGGQVTRTIFDAADRTVPARP